MRRYEIILDADKKESVTLFGREKLQRFESAGFSDALKCYFFFLKTLSLLCFSITTPVGV